MLFCLLSYSGLLEVRLLVYIELEVFTGKEAEQELTCLSGEDLNRWRLPAALPAKFWAMMGSGLLDQGKKIS